ncbi:hypothetical protein [Streptomyces sp. NPDC055013]
MGAEEERSRAAGTCVLAILGGVLVAIAFAIDEAAGVLLVGMSGMVALWRSARRVTDSSATPHREGLPAIPMKLHVNGARGVCDPSGVMCLVHPTPEEGMNDA